VAPSYCFKACACCASLSASIKSAIASAWVRSSFPASNARRLNSPGAASLAPDSIIAERARSMMIRPPCTVSSTTSSPVKLFGAGMLTAKTSSITSPVGLINRSSVARRGGGKPFRKRALAILSASGPDMRKTARAVGGGPLASAQIVSRAVTPVSSS